MLMICITLFNLQKNLPEPIFSLKLRQPILSLELRLYSICLVPHRGQIKELENILASNGYKTAG